MRYPAMVLGLFLCLAGGASAEGPGQPPLRIMIDLPEHHGERLLPLRDAGSQFHVVVLNGGTQPVRLWEEWCSWGAENLRFEVTLPEGKRITIRKQPMEYSKNFPDWFTLGAGEATVREVYPLATTAGKVWDGFPEVPRGATLQVKLRAVFEIPKEDASQAGVWTGRVESRDLEVTLSRQ